MQSALVGEVDGKIGVGSSVVNLGSGMVGRLMITRVLSMASSAVNSQLR